MASHARGAVSASVPARRRITSRTSYGVPLTRPVIVTSPDPVRTDEALEFAERFRRLHGYEADARAA